MRCAIGHAVSGLCPLCLGTSSSHDHHEWKEVLLTRMALMMQSMHTVHLFI